MTTMSELLTEIDAYQAQTGVADRDFSLAVFGDPGRLSLLRRGFRQRAGMTERARSYMRAFPPATSVDRLRESVKVEASAAAVARRGAGAPTYKGRRIDPVVTVMAASMAEPRDAIELIRRRWPAVWEEICSSARKVGAMPGAFMVEMIERGLEAQS